MKLILFYSLILSFVSAVQAEPKFKCVAAQGRYQVSILDRKYLHFTFEFGNKAQCEAAVATIEEASADKTNSKLPMWICGCVSVGSMFRQVMTYKDTTTCYEFNMEGRIRVADQRALTLQYSDPANRCGSEKILATPVTPTTEPINRF